MPKRIDSKVPRDHPSATTDAVDATNTYPILMAEKIITDSECEVRSIMAEAQAKAIRADLYADDIELLKVSYAQKSCDVAKKFALSGMFDIWLSYQDSMLYQSSSCSSNGEYKVLFERPIMVGNKMMYVLDSYK